MRPSLRSFLARATAVVAAASLAAACSKSEDKKKQPSLSARAQQAAGDGGVPKAPQGRKMKQVDPPLPVSPPAADAEKTADGLVFKSLTEGTGAAPARNDGVKIKYSAWRQDGTTFATTEGSNQPTTMWLYSTAPGFTEALQKMKVGGKAMFWLPPEIGYPSKPHGKAETLAYAVELLDVMPAPATPPDVAKAPADATKEKDGVAWKKVTAGDAKADKPRAWDAVELAYTGWDETGKIFDSSEVHGKPVKMPMEKLPPVFAAIVPKMVVGDRVRVWFPAEMLGKGPRTPTGTLTFELQLASVTKLQQPPDAPKDVAKPPADALKTPKGVFYKVLSASKSGKKPGPTDQVKVNYTGWTTDGKRFDSSIPSGHPGQFRVNGVVPGWTDALLAMEVGDKWRIWVPEELAYKGAPNRPQGMLVFDVELLDAQPAPARPPMGGMGGMGGPGGTMPPGHPGAGNTGINPHANTAPLPTPPAGRMVAPPAGGAGKPATP